MGQRHQIYIRLPKIYYNENNCNNRDAKTIGFHHQWLYGATALEVLDNFFMVYDRHIQGQYACMAENGDQQRAEELIEHILSFLPNSGSCENVHNISDSGSIIDPHYGDNNDGITIIDIEETGKPRYAFASLGHTEGEYSLKEGLYSAEEYLTSYWSEDKWNDLEGRGKRNIREVLERLEHVPIIDQERLAEIFPRWGLGTKEEKALVPDVVITH